MNNYPNIDMLQTGKKIEYAIRSAGYDVKKIQSYLQLSCPQPIYRWFKGQILPSVDHLYMLSKLLGVHMEDLLVSKETLTLYYEIARCEACIKKRLMAYCMHLESGNKVLMIHKFF